MAEEQNHPTGGELPEEKPPLRRARWRSTIVPLTAFLVVALLAAWLLRKDIADNVIGGKLESLGLPAHYKVVSIGASQQVVRDLVIGDPKRPDLTVEEVRVETRLYWGFPGIGRVTVVRPRLYGTLHRGKLSFGSLDKVLSGREGGAFEMPDLNLGVVDGRALIDSDYGRIGARLQGEGALRGGFSGEIAAVAPQLAIADCGASGATVYGKITTRAERPRFSGPVRVTGLTCTGRKIALGRVGLQLDVTAGKALDGVEGKLGFRAGAGHYSDMRLDGATGTANFAYRQHALNARYYVAARSIAAPQARFANLSFDGRARSVQGFSRFDIEGDLAGRGIMLGAVFDRAMVEAASAGQGTLVAPVLMQIRGALAKEGKDSALAVNLIARRGDEGLSLVIPHGALRGSSGASLLTLSRMQALFGAGGFPRVTGNFATGGRGLPQISGRMESGSDGRLAMHVTMPEYQAGTSRVELSSVSILQSPDGALTFAGQTRVSGDVPGGRADGLTIPIQGAWAAGGNLSIWPRCAHLTFDRLQLANLTLDRRDLAVCPATGSAMVRGKPGNLRIAVGVPSLDLSGRLGNTPIRIASGPLGYAKSADGAGTIGAKALKIVLGPAESPSQVSVTNLTARIGKDIAGSFGGADVGLYAVPMDLRRAAGDWSYGNGALNIENASFTLVDRQAVPQFNPMVSRDASLRLANNAITAQAIVREPTSNREVVSVQIVHDLASGSGRADLVVNHIQFDDRLQADSLSSLALGVVSNLQGSVHGTGRIEWNGKGIASHGRFATKGLDFAAPFGPVKGLSGEVVLTDLLGLVTAPDQTLRIASINPGIDVTDGAVSFQMQPGYVLQVNGARWPFMNGTLTLEPAQMKIGVAETRHYTLKVDGLDAQTFVQHLELSNLNATGVFDGELPLIFDENGGRIENGHLVSRPPGGNVAYVGELTYKDLSAMGNFAFQTLKSVNYQRMEISLGGTLAGEIITQVSFNGISQGAGAKRNFLTRQIAKLPIRFVLNVKAPFFSLFAPLRSLYDPSYVTDPRTLGLIGTDGAPRASATAHESAIQPPVSEKNP